MTAKIKLNAASGGGSISIQAPSSSSNNRVFTIPDEADATLLTSNTSTGKILQVVNTLKTDTASITSSNTNNFVDISGMSLSITPTATSSKILVFFTLCLGGNAGTFHIRLVRDSTNIGIGDSDGNRLQNTILYRPNSSPYQHSCDDVTNIVLDTPSTTSATTYKLQGSAGSTYSATWYFNRTYNNSNNDYDGRPVSSITAMEVAG